MPRANATPELRYWREDQLGGALLARARYGPHDFQRHVHDEMVIAVTEDGAGKVVTRQGSDVGDAGTVWVFAPGESHGGRVEGSRWFYRGFYLDAAALARLAEVFDDGAESRLFVPPGLYRDPQLARLLLSAHERLEGQPALMERQEAWWCAMGLLFGRHGRPRPPGERAGEESRGVAAAREFLHEHYRRNLSIDELAAVAGLSRYHFMRAFRRELGLPPHAYLNQLRLLAAKDLLASGSAPGDAAAEVGFYDQSHLTRIFKRAYGIKPGSYAAVVRPRSALGAGAAGPESKRMR